MLTNADITIYNKWFNKSTRSDEWQRTYIKGVTWKGKHHTSVIKEGFVSADETQIRIPITAVIKDDKQYVNSMDFQNTPQGRWTLQNGDYIVKGIVDYDIPSGSIKGLVQGYSDVITVLSYADNRDTRVSESMRHWKVAGK